MSTPENSSNDRLSTPWPEREDLAAETSSDSRGGLVMQATVLWVALIVLLAGVVAVLAILGSQFLASAKTGVSLEQCANLGTVCDTDHPSRWQTGNLGQSNAEYYERDVVPYRAILTGLTPGEHYSLGIGWDTTKSGRQAMDFLATYNHTVTAADPCAGLACGTDTDVLGIPADPALAAQAISQWTGQNFTAFGARFHAVGETFPNTGNFCSGAECVISQNPSAYSPLGSFTGDRKNQISLSFEATHETVVVAWGGHLASRNDWGAEFSAATIPGSPYHMRIEGFTCSDATNCSVGQMDRSLNSSGVYLSGSIRIVKNVDIGEQSAPPAFGFEASPAPLSSFTLNDLTPVEEGSKIWTGERLFDDIRTEGIFTVSESAVTGWELASIQCSVFAPNSGSQQISGSMVEIDLREGELVTCTFFNQVATVPPPTTTTTTTTTTIPETTTTGPVITQPGTTQPEATTEVTTVITMPTAPVDETTTTASTTTTEVVIQIQTDTTDPDLILPASGAVIGVADVVLALIFLTLGFGAVMLVRSRNQEHEHKGTGQ